MRMDVKRVTKNRTYDLKKDSIPRVFLHYSLLSIAGLSAMSINIMLDGIFIGRFVGGMGLAAINLVLPLFPILLAIGMCFGYGGAALVGIEFGKGDYKEANHVFNQSFLGVAGVALLVTLLFQVFADPIVSLLGATPLLRADVTVYFRTFSAFSASFCLTLFFEPMVRNDGAPRRVMWSLIMGALTNACLNSIFIIVLGWGLFGASLATGIATLVSCIYLSYYFIKKRGKLYFQKTTFVLEKFGQIFRTGCPALATQVCQAIFIIVYNWVMIAYLGELGVAALGIILYMNELVMLCNYGFGEALQPLASYNLGAASYGRMRKTFKTAATAALAVSALLTAFILIAPGIFVSFFTTETELTALAIKGSRLYYAALVFQSFNMIVIYYLGAVRKPLASTALALVRNIGCFLLTVLLLPRFLGELGVWLAIPAADLLAFLFVLVVIFKNKFYFVDSSPKL